MKPDAVPPQRSGSYQEILRSTALIGASSVVVMFLSLVRMKAVAMLLGPAGIGLFALYTMATEVVVSAAGLGLNQSGVRAIAQAEGTGERDSIAPIIHVLRRVSLVLGLVGAIGLAALSVPASWLTFGTPDHALALAALGLLVLWRILIGAHAAVLQGRRQLGALALLSILGAVASVVATVPLVLVWGEAAVVPALILSTAGGWLVARHLGRRACAADPAAGTVRFGSHALELLRLGVAFMISGFLTMGAGYAIRIIVLHESGVAAAGLYQAAWVVAGLYVGVVLQSMGSDFYPRLTGAAHDNAEVGRLVNEQTEVSLLLAGPGVLATITFAQLAVVVFYSPEFADAAGLLRWLCLGMMLRVVSWPLGFVVIAKGWQRVFVAVEIMAAAVHVGLAALLIQVVGLDGAGVAFALLYVVHSLLVYGIARRRCGFSFSRRNLLLMPVFGISTATVFAGFAVLPFWWATALGTVLIGATGVFSLIELRRIVPSRFLSLKLPFRADAFLVQGMARLRK